MFRNPFKRNEALVSALLDFHGVTQPPIPPSETPLFDATVLATGTDPVPLRARVAVDLATNTLIWK